MKHLSILILCLFIATAGQAKTRTCSNNDFETVANAVNGTGTPTGAGVTSSAGGDCPSGKCTNAAVAGDIVQLQAGTGADWTNLLTISKNITLTGPQTPIGQPTAIITMGTASGFNGLLISFQTDGGTDGVTEHNTATLKNIWFKVHGHTSPYIVSWSGNARFHYNGAVPAGGFRMSNCRFSPTPGFVTSLGFIVDFGGWLTGVADHNFSDFSTCTAAATFHVGTMASAPGVANVSTTSTITLHGHTFKPNSGSYAYSFPHVWGGAPGRTTDPASVMTGGVAEDDALYIEDNVCEYTNFIVSIPDAGGTTHGGSTVVARHNTVGGSMNSHAFSGSGQDAGCKAAEFYNNFYVPLVAQGSVKIHNPRSGGAVAFNERFFNYNNPGANLKAGLAPQSFDRVGSPSDLGMIGIVDGTNFFDNNHRGSLSWVNLAGTHFGPISPLTNEPAGAPFTGAAYSSDTRVGSVYFTGAASNTISNIGNTTVTISGSTPSFATAGPGGGACPVNYFEGWTLRDRTKCLPAVENDGGQKACDPASVQRAGMIVSSQASSGNSVTVTVAQGWQSAGVPCLVMDPTDIWELRYVDEYFAVPGSSSFFGRLNGGNNSNPAVAGPPAFVSPSPIPAPGIKWVGQTQDGLWDWNNKAWNSGTNSWINVTSNSNPFDLKIPGGTHRGVVMKTANGAIQDYPVPVPSPIPDNYYTVGADWVSGNQPASVPRKGQILKGDSGGLVAADIMGSIYPHPLVSQAAAQPQMTASGTNTFYTTSTPAVCTAGAEYNCFKITTSGFSPAATTITKTGAIPANTTFTNNGDGTAVISGTANGEAAQSWPFTITASNGSQSATQGFTITTSSPNHPPNRPTISSPSNNSSFNVGQTVTVTASATDPDGDTIQKMEFFDAGTLINTITQPDLFTYTNNAFALGTHTLTAKATDTGGATSVASTTITFTVTSGPPPSPSPAQIIIKP